MTNLCLFRIIIKSRLQIVQVDHIVSCIVGFLLKMLLRTLPVYILKQLFFSISVNSGRIFTEIEKNNRPYTVSDAILTSRQSGQKLQCLYGNPMANNFFQNRILHKL